MSDLLVVREIRNDGMQEVYLLNADTFTIASFQMWMFGFNSDGAYMSHGSERNEILGYYPNVNEYEDTASGDNPLTNSYHKQWADPDGLPRRFSPDPE
jgi:hypothetical protein